MFQPQEILQYHTLVYMPILINQICLNSQYSGDISWVISYEVKLR